MKFSRSIVAMRRKKGEKNGHHYKLLFNIFYIIKNLLKIS